LSKQISQSRLLARYSSVLPSCTVPLVLTIGTNGHLHRTNECLRSKERRAKNRKNLSSARHYDQIRFRLHTAKTPSGQLGVAYLKDGPMVGFDLARAAGSLLPAQGPRFRQPARSAKGFEKLRHYHLSTRKPISMRGGPPPQIVVLARRGLSNSRPHCVHLFPDFCVSPLTRLAVPPALDAYEQALSAATADSRRSYKRSMQFKACTVCCR
jgi:hypothetical protein